jgi:glycosyltransferase involved in cell wall biosynthesis
VTRVLLVGKGPPDRGGISAYLGALQTSDLASKHALTVLSLTRDETPRAGRLTGSNVTRTLSDARAVFRSAGDADLVHQHTALVPAVTMLRAGLLALAARIRGRRVILHVHSGQVELWITTRARRLLTRIALAPAHHVVTMSNPSGNAIAAAIGRRKVTIVDNWIDAGAYRPADPVHSPPRVFYAGLLTPRKGVGDLLRASAMLSERGVAHELVLAGGTPDEGPEAEREVRSMDAPAATFLGALPHERIAAELARADVFCLPSWYEAMPLSILEAMASGLPVVATDVGDIPRVVAQGVTGDLVPARSPERLADALEALLTDPEGRRRMGAAGRQRVEQDFTQERAVAALDRLYRQLVP